MNDSDPERTRLDADELAQRLRAAGYPVPADMFADEAGVEWITATPQRTLRDWRRAGRGPPAFRTSRWLYPIDDLVAWLQAVPADRRAIEREFWTDRVAGDDDEA